MLTRVRGAGIDRGTFGAINGASIVYDGAIVTDARFRTNDPCVWSAGPAARFARRYRHKLAPGLCSAREAGAKLGASLLAALDPLAPSDDTDAVPPFTTPRAGAATLVGGVHYAHVSLPRAGCADHAAVTSHRKYGRELVTDAGGCDEFTAVQLDKSGARPLPRPA